MFMVLGNRRFSRHVTKSTCFSEKGPVCCICSERDCLVPYDDKKMLWKHVLEHCQNISQDGNGADSEGDSSENVNTWGPSETFGGSLENTLVAAQSFQGSTDFGASDSISSELTLNPNNIRCPRCFKHYSGRRALYLHVKLSNCLAKKGAVCCICHKTDCSVPYDNKSLLWKHICIAYRFRKITTHTNPDSAEDIEYSCPACFKNILGNRKFYRHVTTSSCFRNKSSVCMICSDSDCSVPYGDKKLLWNHVLEHSPDKPEVRSVASVEEASKDGLIDAGLFLSDFMN